MKTNNRKTAAMHHSPDSVIIIYVSNLSLLALCHRKWHAINRVTFRHLETFKGICLNPVNRELDLQQT